MKTLSRIAIFLGLFGFIPPALLTLFLLKPATIGQSVFSNADLSICAKFSTVTIQFALFLLVAVSIIYRIYSAFKYILYKKIPEVLRNVYLSRLY